MDEENCPIELDPPEGIEDAEDSGRGAARLDLRRRAAGGAQLLGLRRSRRGLGAAAGRDRPSHRQGRSAQRLHAGGEAKAALREAFAPSFGRRERRRVGQASKAARSTSAGMRQRWRLWQRQTAGAHARLAACAASRPAGGARASRAGGIGPARAHHQARHRGGDGGVGTKRAPAPADAPRGRHHRARARPPGLPDAKILALYDKGSYELVPHDKMRRVIAERLTLAKQTIPHYYLSIDCRIDELLRARERMNAAAPSEGPRAYRLSVNDFIIKALALALQEVPAANATWTEGRHAAPQVFRRRRRRRHRGRAVHAGRCARPRRSRCRRSPTRCAILPSAPASAASPRTSTRAARPRSPTSACTASRTSTP